MSSDPRRIEALIEEAHGWNPGRPKISEADTTESKIITRDAVLSAAKAWAEADHEEGFTRGDPESTMRQINQKSDEVDKARKNFEKILDAWQVQLLNKNTETI